MFSPTIKFKSIITDNIFCHKSIECIILFIYF